MKLSRDQLREMIAEQARTRVAMAQLPCAAIVAELFAEDTDPKLPDPVSGDGTAGDEANLLYDHQLIWQIVVQELTAHLAAQTTWPELTDSDLLTLAFTDLAAAGIVAREDFTCCQTCGTEQISDEISQEIDDTAVPVRGYRSQRTSR